MRFGCTNMAILGIGKLDRERLALILKTTQQTISVSQAAKILGINNIAAAKLLSYWAANGWISRIKRGIYIPVPLESTTSDITLENPWVIAEKLYHPCYIAGWSAAEHSGLTEQIFRTIVIFTTQKQRNNQPIINGTHFLIHTISEQTMFGLKSIWYGETKVFVSDPSRTILDMLANPKFGGGIRSAADMLINYLNSENKDLPLLFQYAKKIKNGTVFKRLGFLLEKYAPQETETIALCKKELTKGKIKLDPNLPAEKLITRWQLWVPANWKEENDK